MFVQMSKQATLSGRPSLLTCPLVRRSDQTLIGQTSVRKFKVASYALSSDSKETRTAEKGAAGNKTTKNQAPRVVVLGGGFGGLNTAIRLRQLLWQKTELPKVTLVDKAERSVFKPLLYDFISGVATEEEIAPKFDSLLKPYDVGFIQAGVADIQLAGPAQADDAAGEVTLSDGSSLPFDFLVLALGADPNVDQVPGVSQRAVPLSSHADVARVKELLDALARRRHGVVSVVGAGYAGVELAAAAAERLRNAQATVQLLTPGETILPAAAADQRAAALKALLKLGVRVLTGTQVKALLPPPENQANRLSSSCVIDAEVRSADGGGATISTPIYSDVVFWAAGQHPATSFVAATLPAHATAGGFIQTDPTLQVKGIPRVFALGDASFSPGAAGALPATAQVALQQAAFVAWNIWAAAHHRPLLPFKYQHLGNMMSLGQANAVVALPFAPPEALARSLASSPLHPLLEAAGVHLRAPKPSGKSGSSQPGRASPAAADEDAGVMIDGPLAAVMRRAAYLLRQPTGEQRRAVLRGWVCGGIGALTGKDKEGQGRP